MVTSILDNDMELSALCLAEDRYKKFWEDPINTINSIVAEQTRSDGEEFSFILSDEEVQQRIWKAQIKNLFPLIESYRGEFVSKYLAAIEKVLPISSSNGEQFTKPHEVEIGTLYYMACNGDIDVNSQDFKRLKCFKEARNKLAHIEVLRFKEIEELFKWI